MDEPTVEDNMGWNSFKEVKLGGGGGGRMKFEGEARRGE